MVSRTRNDSFSWYAEKCRELQRDLEHVLTDLKFSQEQGGKVRYAVDFSEIFAYAQPSRTMQEFSLFDDDSKSWLDSLHRLALRRLFNNLPEKLILLKPYETETNNFLLHQDQRLFVALLEQAPSIYRARERLNNSKEFSRIKQLDIDKKVESRKPLTHDEKEKVRDFLLKNETLSLLAFLDWQGAKPKERVRDLIRAQRFERLEDLVEIDDDFFMAADRYWEDWYGVLAKQRRGIERLSAASLDATAIATVEQANQLLESQKDQKRKLLLVTRSPTMHNSFVRLSSRSLERRADNSFLRHPRIFSFSIQDIPEEKTRRQIQDQLEDLKQKVNTFLEELGKHEVADIDEDLGIKSQLDNLLSKVKEGWRSTNVLIASLLRDATSDEADDSSQQDLEEIRAILRLLRSDQVQRLIVDRLKDLTHDLALVHLQLGGYVQYVQGSDQSQHDFLTDHLVARASGTIFIVEVSKFPLLHQAV
jgi:hypothetical protein